MAKMGRKLIEIDKDLFINACSLQCTLPEVAFLCKCSEDTVERWCRRELSMTFAESFRKYRVGGQISLRRTQFRLAEKSAAMAIFLGKNYLGQRDVIENVDNSEKIKELKAIFEEIKS